MIISHEHKFIFIKTAKTVGTSIEVSISQQCGPSDIVTPIPPPVEGHEPSKHEQFVNPISDLLRRQEGLRYALRHAFKRSKEFHNHMPAWLVQKRVPAWIWEEYIRFQRTNFGSLKSGRLCFEAGWRTNRRFEADKRFERIGKRRNEVGTAAAYLSHTYYGFHKHSALGRQEDPGSRRWINLSLFHFLFRGISLPERQLYAL